MSNNLKIDEEEMSNVLKSLKQQIKKMEKKVAEYNNILSCIKNDAIISGELSEALEAYITYSKLLKDQFYIISQDCSKLIVDFIAEVDRDDKYIY